MHISRSDPRAHVTADFFDSKDNELGRKHIYPEDLADDKMADKKADKPK